MLRDDGGTAGLFIYFVLDRAAANLASRGTNSASSLVRYGSDPANGTHGTSPAQHTRRPVGRRSLQRSGIGGPLVFTAGIAPLGPDGEVVAPAMSSGRPGSVWPTEKVLAGHGAGIVRHRKPDRARRRTPAGRPAVSWRQCGVVCRRSTTGDRRRCHGAALRRWWVVEIEVVAALPA